MNRYDEIYARFARLVLFIVGVGLIVGEFLADHNHHEPLYFLGVALAGGPFANLMEAIFLGKIRIQITTRNNGENGDKGTKTNGDVA